MSRKKSIINRKIFGPCGSNRYGPIGEEFYDEERGEWRNLQDEIVLSEMEKLHGEEGE